MSVPLETGRSVQQQDAEHGDTHQLTPQFASDLLIGVGTQLKVQGDESVCVIRADGFGMINVALYFDRQGTQSKVVGIMFNEASSFVSLSYSSHTVEEPSNYDGVMHYPHAIHLGDPELDFPKDTPITREELEERVRLYIGVSNLVVDERELRRDSYYANAFGGGSIVYTQLL